MWGAVWTRQGSCVTYSARGPGSWSFERDGESGEENLEPEG